MSNEINENVITSKIINDFKPSDKYKLFDKYESYIKDWYFFKPKGIHGSSHAKRVLYLSLINSMLNNLDENEEKILIYASCFHDIGRYDDKKNDDHGKKSFEKLQTLYVFDEIQREISIDDIKILQFIRENHNIDDEYGIKNLSKYSIQNKEKAIKMYKFLKDSDGLDRIRLKKYLPKDIIDKFLGKVVDPDFLRIESSKELLDFSYQLCYKNILF